MRSRARKSPLRHLVWILPLLVLDFFLFRWLALRQGGCRPAPTPLPVPAETALETPRPPPPVWQAMVPPTPQTNLLNPDEPGVLMPTASGRLESAKYGSTRTVKIKMKNGRTLTTLVLTDGKWLAETIWFK